MGALVGVISAAVAIATGGLALAFQVFPNLKPRAAPPRIEAKIGEVTIEQVTLREYIDRFGRRDLRRELEEQYIKSASAGRHSSSDYINQGFKPEDAELLEFQEEAQIENRAKTLTENLVLITRGLLVFAEVKTAGIRGRVRSPRAHLYSADGLRREAIGGQRVRFQIVELNIEGEFVLPGNIVASGEPFRARAEDDLGVAVFFLRCQKKTVRVRFELADDRGRLVDIETTRPTRCP
jgi:hypothetical protein